MTELDQIKTRVSNNHKKIRDIFNLTQEDIAKRIGIGRATISKVESKNQKFKITKPNMLLTAFIFKKELEKKKKKIAGISLIGEEIDYTEVINQLEDASIKEDAIKDFLGKHGQQFIKTEDKEKKDMIMYMWFYILADLFKKPNEVDLPNEFLDEETLKKIVDGLINYYEFTLKDIFLNKEEKFNVNQTYDFDPYKFMDYVNGKEV
jgi:transcriptional regulator with XRE-family HTH domain